MPLLFISISYCVVWWFLLDWKRVIQLCLLPLVTLFEISFLHYHSISYLKQNTSFTIYSKALFKHQTLRELNLIHWIKYMKSLVSESIIISNACVNLEWLSRSFCLARLGISTLERLWFRYRTFYVPNLMHKLLCNFVSSLT